MSFIILPAIAGTVTGALIFVFKLVAENVMELSRKIYIFAGDNPIYTPLILLGAAALAMFAIFLTKTAPVSSGGGIPTAIAALRGLFPFKWLRTVFCVFFSSLCTFLGGVPLDNEGPSVQMGTCIGRGVCSVSGKRYRGADRYVMTGGACAGIAVTTGAPISGIFFALEDSHRRFTPTIFMSATVGVISGVLSSSVLSNLTKVNFSLFRVPVQSSLKLSHIWIVVIISLFAAVINIGILGLFDRFKKLDLIIGKKRPYLRRLIFVGLFVLMALVGILLPDALGTGHHLTDEIILNNRTWYILIALICLRGLFTAAASVADVTGGLFVPIITFGAMSGAIIADALIALGIVSPQYYGSLVVIGIGSFLSASLKTPITAILFTVEIFGGIVNAPYLILAVALSFAVTEFLGKESINDSVMEHKIEEVEKNGRFEIIDTKLTVMPDAFVVGMETRDILWPASCRVLTIISKPDAPDEHGIKEGDELHLHFITHDFERTAEELKALIGEQEIPREYSPDMDKIQQEPTPVQSN